jgi:hypothetical protein
MFLATLLSAVGIFSACAFTATTGGGQTENKQPEPTKKVETENKNTPQPSPTQQQELVNVIDGRKDWEEKDGTKEETDFVNKEYKRNEAAILKSTELECDEGTEDGVSIVGTAEGSFTKSNSSQKIYLYERCRSGRSFGIGGILVAENGKAVTHYSYGENGLDSGIFSLPDINKNGLSEIGIVAGGTGQGYTNTAVYLFEFKDGKMNFLGSAATFDDNSGAMEDDSKVETNAYKISVQSGEKPVFFREHYQKKGSAEKWSLVKKSEKFSLEKGDVGKYNKIS